MIILLNAKYEKNGQVFRFTWHGNRIIAYSQIWESLAIKDDVDVEDFLEEINAFIYNWDREGDWRSANYAN